jgi:hypothetical protein
MGMYREYATVKVSPWRPPADSADRVRDQSEAADIDPDLHARVAVDDTHGRPAPTEAQLSSATADPCSSSGSPPRALICVKAG